MFTLDDTHSILGEYTFSLVLRNLIYSCRSRLHVVTSNKRQCQITTSSSYSRILELPYLDKNHSCHKVHTHTCQIFSKVCIGVIFSGVKFAGMKFVLIVIKNMILFVVINGKLLQNGRLLYCYFHKIFPDFDSVFFE